MFIKSLKIFLSVLTLLLIGCSKESAQTTKKIPAQFKADRIFVQPVTKTGFKLTLYTDTGGGANMLFKSTVEKLGLKTESLRMGKNAVLMVPFPKFKPGNSIPPPLNKPPFGENMYVPGNSQAEISGADGFLGRTWFAGKIWELDYTGKSVGVMDSVKLSGVDKNHLVPLGFQKDTSGNKTTSFPRLTAEVDGDTLNFLFDTGALVSLKDSAYNSLNDGMPQERGTSFIVKSIFEKWEKNHPDWKVVKDADKVLNMPMIEVPKVSVGGYSVGPVWFTMRPDNNFYGFMSRWMDKAIDGALGGSTFHYFTIILNYPGEYAVFKN
jgi:hypothetical protein